MTLLGLLDLSAAFNCVDHSILLDRLRSAVVLSDSVLDWLRSFLTDRTQQIAYSGQLSAVQPVLFGSRKDPYWVSCCTFSTQLSWPSLSLVMASTFTNMPTIRRSTSALRPGTLRQPSHVSLCVLSLPTVASVSSTSRLG